MSSFRYTAVNREQKQLSGVIRAETEEIARKLLNELGFSILSIAEEKESIAVAAEGERFSFEALDPNKKKIMGTIVAKDRYTAYQRLTDEYGFDVAALYGAKATPEEIELAKREGVADLKSQRATERVGQKIGETEKSVEAEEVRRKALLAQVNFALHKVDALLTRYGTDLNPETKRLIKAAVDRLLRIRSSTNLDYIEHMTESLLRLIQDEELFLHRDQFQEDQKRLALETEQMLMSLHKARKAKTSHLRTYLEACAACPEPTWKSKILCHIARPILNIFPQKTPELQTLQQKKRVIREQMLTAWRIAFTAKKKELREEAWNSLSALRKEKRRNKEEIHLAKEHMRQKRFAEKIPSRVLRECNLATGCLLVFYLAYYLMGYYLQTKKVALPLLERMIVDTRSLQYIVLFLFLLHAGTSLKLTFFPQSRVAMFVVVPTFLIAYLLIVVNL